MQATPKLVTVASFSAGNVVGTAIPQDQATLSGGFNISGGSVTFTLKAPDNTIVDMETIPFTVGGIYNTANTFIANQVGTYTWSASYSGNVLNAVANDQGGTQEQLTTMQATPKLVTVASFSAGNVVGTAIPQDQATLSGGFNISGGSVTFTLKAPDNTIVDMETIPFTSGGIYNTANTFIANQVGKYTWSASYSGDVLNAVANDQGGTQEQVTTMQATPKLVTVASFSAGNVVGTAIHKIRRRCRAASISVVVRSRSPSKHRTIRLSIWRRYLHRWRNLQHGQHLHREPGRDLHLVSKLQRRRAECRALSKGAPRSR